MLNENILLVICLRNDKFGENIFVFYALKNSFLYDSFSKDLFPISQP